MLFVSDLEMSGKYDRLDLSSHKGLIHNSKGDKMATTSTRPAFRKPWTHGAHAYAEADTFEAFAEGMKRKRVMQMVKMPNDGEAGLKPCIHCGIALRDPYPVSKGSTQMHTDKKSTWTWIPKRKVIYGEHYYCSWGALMQQILDYEGMMRL